MGERIDRYRKGHSAERLARYFLWWKGYRLLAMRYRTKSGEIDLIVAKGRQIVFCEVKARKNLTDGLEAVSLKSQERIRNTAMLFMRDNRRFHGHSWRFDVVIIMPWRLPYHLQDAWRSLV